jgi:hypothetical protein
MVADLRVKATMALSDALLKDLIVGKIVAGGGLEGSHHPYGSDQRPIRMGLKPDFPGDGYDVKVPCSWNQQTRATRSVHACRPVAKRITNRPQLYWVGKKRGIMQ